MANTIKVKRSSTTGAQPTTAQLDLGEIAINTFDGRMFIRRDNGTASIVEIGGGGGGASSLDGLSDVAITSAAKGQFLAHNGTEFINTRTIETSGAAVTPIIVKGAASQTANLLEVQNSSGTSLFTTKNDGGVVLSGGGWNSAPLVVSGEIGNNPAFNIRGIVAGGSGSYGWLRIIGGGTGIIDFETSNSAGGSWNGRILGGGGLITVGTSGAGGRGYPAWFGGWDATYPSLSLVTLNAAAKGLVVKGAASQTANLVEAQNSAGTALFYVNVDNGLTANGTTSAMFVQSGTNNRPTAIFRKSAAPNFGFIEFQDSAGVVNGGVTKDFTFFTGGAILSGNSGFQLYGNSGIGSAGIRSNSLGSALSVGSNITPSDDCTFFVATASSYNSQRGLVIQQRAAGADANVFECKNSAGTNLATIGPKGDSIFTTTNTAGVPLRIMRPASHSNYALVVRNSAGMRVFGIGCDGSIAGEPAGWSGTIEFGNDLYQRILMGYHNATGGLRILSNANTIQSWESPGGAAGIYYLTLARNTTTTSWNFSPSGFATSVRFETTLHANSYVGTCANAFATSLGAGGVTINASLGNTILGALSGNLTNWAFTNVTAENSKVQTIKVVIAGNASFTYGDACSINGVAVTDGVQWSGGSAPTATSGTDIIEFTIVRDSGGSYKVFGAATTNYS